MSIFAASVDNLEKTQTVAENLGFPVAWGVDKQVADQLGAFWNEKGGYIQPTELLVNQKGRVLSTCYSSSPIGRMEPKDVLSWAKFLASQR